jgi:serine protease Do
MQVKVALAEWVQKNPSLTSAKLGGRAGELSNELGFTVHILTHELAARFNVEMKPGVLVIKVEEGTVAARKGLKPGDIVTSVNQQTVTSPEQFRDALKKADLKRGVALSLISGAKTRSLVLKKGGE